MLNEAIDLRNISLALNPMKCDSHYDRCHPEKPTETRIDMAVQE